MTVASLAAFLSARPVLAALVPVAPVEGAEVPLVPAVQRQVMALGTLEERLGLFAEDKKNDRKLRKSKDWRRAEPLVLSWRVTEGEKGPWKIELGKADDLSDARVWYLTDAACGGTNSLVRTGLVARANLELGATYFWRVSRRDRCERWNCGANCSCAESRRIRQSAVARFRTADLAPRWIEIEGRAGNMRDLGGRIGLGGRRVRQGLVFRGEGLNDNSLTGETRGRNRLMAEDIAYLTDTLGIRTDLDLRSSAETAGMTGSPMGPKVRFLHVPTESYREIFKPEGMKAMARAFRVFCDRRNYPVYFHCIAGADRTGALAYVLNGVLGVDRHELETDWESTFYPGIPDADPDPDFWRRESHFNDGFAKFGGPEASWNDRIVLYLKACGITDAEIATVRGVLLSSADTLPLTDMSTRELFNGRDLTGWYTYLQGKGRDVDPDGVFTVTNGVIRVSGRGFGALVSEEEFSDYRLRVEYRFLGGEQFGWKKGWAPDSGILFHSTGPDGAFDGTWMESLELNLIKGATGDFWGVGAPGRDTIALSCRVGARRHEGKYAVYDPAGADVFTITGNTRVCRCDLDPAWRDRYETGIAANERPIGEWNVAELVCRGDEVTAIFNGKVVNRGFGAKPSRGRIQLQAEGCPIEFRRVTVTKEEGALHRCRVSGRAPSGTYIVANTGEIVRADTNNHYEITLPVQGVYCLKAMRNGYRELVRPWLTVPAPGPVNFDMWARRDPAFRLNHGNVGHPAQLRITDSGRPVRGFDLAGTEVGSYPASRGYWHQRNPFLWTLGEYCFMSTGEVKIVESLDFRDLRTRGWYKGDFHAHVIHGENFYRANIQQMNLVCRAERYDWIWLSQNHANDDYPIDHGKVAEFLSDKDLFLRINNEFPKNLYGHFGDLGVPPLWTDDYGPGYDEDKVTNLELAEKTVYARGGLCVPVHPLYGDVVKTDKETGRKRYGMINNELLLWLLCRPDLVPVVDFFYFPEVRAEKFWYRLLNRGYTLACSGTSDAAFDVGRSPGSEHATYAKLERIDNESILKAFREGRTMVSYFGAGILLDIDGKTSGDRLSPGPETHTMTVDAWADPGLKFAVEVIRNGEVFERRELTAPADGHMAFSRTFVERENAWYVAILRRSVRSPQMRAAASPIYFRGPDFRPPETFRLPMPLPDRLRERIKFLTPEETDTDAWYEEMRGMLREASRK